MIKVNSLFVSRIKSLETNEGGMAGMGCRANEKKGINLINKI